MNVKVKIWLIIAPTSEHEAQMRLAASGLTNDRESVTISIPSDQPDVIVAEFSTNKARQTDIVDEIRKGFSCPLYDYSDIAISFPKRRV